MKLLKNIMIAVAACSMFAFTSCADFFKSMTSVTVVNNYPNLNDPMVESISLLAEDGKIDVDEYTPVFTKGLLKWNGLPGGYQASDSVYTYLSGTLTVKVKYSTSEGEYFCEVPVKVIEKSSGIEVSFENDEKGKPCLKVVRDDKALFTN